MTNEMVKTMRTLAQAGPPQADPPRAPAHDAGRTEGVAGARPYTVGIMTMEVEGRDSARFNAIVARTVKRFDASLAHEGRVMTRVLAFPGHT